MAPRTEGATLPSSSPRGDRRSQYYASLSVLWCVRLSAWLLGAYLVRVGFSVDSLKLYIAMSVFLAIVFNVLPDGQAPTAPPPAKAADCPTRPGATHQDKTAASPSQRTQPSEVCEADVGCHSDAPTPRTPPLSLVERVRLGNMMRVLGTPGAMRCVTDASFRALMLEKGAELPRDDACPCGSGETFQRCCYAVPQTLKDWANSVD